MSENPIEFLLERYLHGETSAGENELVERWLEQNGNNDNAWKQLNQNDKSVWLSGIFNDIHKDMHAAQVKTVVLPRARHSWKMAVAAAAAAIILFTAYLEWSVFNPLLPQNRMTALTVPANQKKQIILADGSKIWVNEGSELKYPKKFDGQTREVYLKGEAYFDIQHDATKPFIIHTGKLITTVLGTAFNIREDQTLHTIVVTVTRGKVGVTNGKQQLGIIRPNQQISFNSIQETSVQTRVNAQSVIAWQEKDMHFDDLTFAEAALQLQKRFHVKINFSNDHLKNCRFSGTALTGDQLDKILKVICSFNHATYQQRPDGSILIDGPGCD